MDCSQSQRAFVSGEMSKRSAWSNLVRREIVAVMFFLVNNLKAAFSAAEFSNMSYSSWEPKTAS